MDVHNLSKIFNPQRIALIGITSNPNSVGGKVLGNLITGGFRGVVYPVNPDNEAVLGISCFPDVKSLPKVPELAVICTAAESVHQYVKECGENGILGIIIMSAGFKEIGEAGVEMEKQIMLEVKNYPGMRIIGPNCLGIIAPAIKMNLSFSNGMPKPGNVAFISQSGALCTSVLDWAIQENIGFSQFISIGNTMDVGFGDLIDFLGEDDKTDFIILYIESISLARKFMTAARAFARTKPIIAYKAGMFPESAEVAASHTGAMASEDAVYDAAFKRIGIARVFELGKIFDCVELIGRNKIPKGSRLGIVTNAGGPGVIASDALIAADGSLAKLSEESMQQLNENLPAFWSHGNPVDVLGDARSKRIAKALNIVIQDKGVDAVLVILTPQAMTNPTTIAKEVIKLSETTSKPVLAAWLGGKLMHEGMELFKKSGVAGYSTPEQAVNAFMTLVQYSRNLKSLYETPKDIPVDFTLDRKAFREKFDSSIKGKNEILSEEVSKMLVEAYGIPSTMPKPAGSADEASKIAEANGFPVVLKVLSKDITHKSDVGGVMLNLSDKEAVEIAFNKIKVNVANNAPNAIFEGVTVQPMINPKNSVELIVGIKKDSVFGTIILVGMGGILAELMGDKAIGFPPLNESLARQMLESLKIWPLLNGYRGNPPVNIDKLIEVMIRLSYLAADYPEIKELDINPLMINENSVIALDARIVIDKEVLGREIIPYENLALHPYPEKYVQKIKFDSGVEVLFRPIKPEDELMWFELLGSCSKESLYSRFRYLFKWKTHEVASRYCYIDYDREIAIVAEIVEDGQRKLIGVGRLVADPNYDTVEYAILVADSWQNKELGSKLTDYCMDIAEKWKLKKIIAQTTSDNSRMISVLKKRGFSIEFEKSGSGVFVEKII
ncbi:MAG: bifunctional acetate--CoA ligase family protein/GNAT family N-acetyltransferase [Saprospiraceae bacterium]|nr:bifunctional acetate--CoA ligase family protein/GNAT family N-acetyltransferase [Saprospiraceae bacterium]